MGNTISEKATGNELLRQYLAAHHVPVAHSVEELLSHSVADDNGEEVDDFLRTLDEWRHGEAEEERRLD